MSENEETSEEVLDEIRRSCDGLYRMPEVLEKLEYVRRVEKAIARERDAVRKALEKLDECLFVGVDGLVHGQLGKTEEIERTLKGAIAMLLGKTIEGEEK